MSPEAETEALAVRAHELSTKVPSSTLRELAARIHGIEADPARDNLLRVLAGFSNSIHRLHAAEFLKAWKSESPNAGKEAAVAALLTAARAAEAFRDRQHVELVWTGPPTARLPVRRTEQAVQQVINSARRNLLVVSYAVYRIPRIREAIMRAAARGVTVQIVVETPEPGRAEDAYNTLLALGASVLENCDVYLWPHDQRPKDEQGRAGIFHAKCAAADGRLLFLSSANLTEYAFDLNIELGVLISGGAAPRMVEEHFQDLVRRGTLRRVGKFS